MFKLQPRRAFTVFTIVALCAVALIILLDPWNRAGIVLPIGWLGQADSGISSGACGAVLDGFNSGWPFAAQRFYACGAAASNFLAVFLNVVALTAMSLGIAALIGHFSVFVRRRAIGHK